jgi:hypothetical protein
MHAFAYAYNCFYICLYDACMLCRKNFCFFMKYKQIHANTYTYMHIHTNTD